MKCPIVKCSKENLRTRYIVFFNIYVIYKLSAENVCNR